MGDRFQFLAMHADYHEPGLSGPLYEALSAAMRCCVCQRIGWQPVVLDCCEGAVVCLRCIRSTPFPCPCGHRITLRRNELPDVVLLRLCGSFNMWCGACGAVAAHATGSIVRDHPWCDGTDLFPRLCETHPGGEPCDGGGSPPCHRGECILLDSMAAWYRSDDCPWRPGATEYLAERWLPALMRRRKAYWADLSFRRLAAGLRAELFDLFVESLSRNKRWSVTMREIASVAKTTGGVDRDRVRRLREVLRPAPHKWAELRTRLRGLGFADAVDDDPAPPPVVPI